MSGYTLGQEFGHGRTRQFEVIPGASPDYPELVAGAGYSFALQRSDRWRLVFCTFTLTTDENVADRYCTIEYPDGSGVSESADGASVLVTASTGPQRFLGQYRRGPAEWDTGTDVWFPLCGIWLEAGRTVSLSIANVQAGDELANVRFTFDRLLVDDDGSERVRELELEQRLEALERAGERG